MKNLEPSNTMHVNLDGVFDLRSARLVVGWLRGHESNAPVVIDFRGTQTIFDNALGFLADSLRQCSNPVVFHGLGKHHRRVMRYFGASLVPDDHSDALVLEQRGG